MIWNGKFINKRVVEKTMLNNCFILHHICEWMFYECVLKRWMPADKYWCAPYFDVRWWIIEEFRKSLKWSFPFYKKISRSVQICSFPFSELAGSIWKNDYFLSCNRMFYFVKTVYFSGNLEPSWPCHHNRFTRNLHLRTLKKTESDFV